MLRTKTSLFAPMLVLILAGCGGGTTTATGGSTGGGQGGDTSAPSTPTTLTATASGQTSINLSWNASSDNVGVTGYVIRRNNTPLTTVAATVHVDSGLAPATTYDYTVAARDAAGNLSPNSPVASATTSGTLDTTRPSTPTGLGATVAGATQINLNWTASTDNVGVTGYQLDRCQGAGCTNFAQIATPAGTSFSNTGLTPATSYTYRVRAADAASNISFNSAAASATTAAGTSDTTPPSAPTSLAATAAGSSSINLSWNASTDNIGVTGYIVRRNGSIVATLGVTTNHADTGLSAGTTYYYTVAAFDLAGNNSNLSASAQATTTGTPPPGPGIPMTLGWHELPNTRLQNVCPPAAQFPAIQGNEGCAAVVDDWAGGALDTTLNRLLIWGGGHGGYGGNEVYAFNLDTLTMARLNDPSNPRDGCFGGGGKNADGTPVSRHSYNHLTYVPALNSMFAWGGSQWECGFMAGDTWLFNLTTLTWLERSSAGGPSANYGRAVAYDPNTGLVYARDDFNLFSYNPSTNTWSVRSPDNGMDDNKTAVIDPVRKRYYLHQNGSNILYWYDISSPTGSVPRQSGATSGCAGFIGNYEVGMEYDSVQDRIVGWANGNTVYILNPDTLTCTTVSHAGGPSSVPNGTWGRFRYSPSLNIFFVCNRIDQNCYALRLTL